MKSSDIDKLMVNLRGFARAHKLKKPEVIVEGRVICLKWPGRVRTLKAPEWDDNEFEKLVRRLRRWS